MDESESNAALMGDVENAPTSMTVEDLVGAVSDSVAGALSERLDALESRLDSVAGRAQLDGLSERIDALSTREDLRTVEASLSAQMDEAALQAGELVPVDEDVGTLIVSLVGQLLEAMDSDGDGASDVASVVEEIRAGVEDIAGALVHPAMTTDFADYTVLEALLLLLVVWKFFKLWLSCLEDGFLWLR